MPNGIEIEIPSRTRSLDGYLAEPDEGGEAPHAGVIVIHEIFGLDDHIRDVARRFAAEGYVALAPNLFPADVARLMTPESVQMAMASLREAPAEARSDPAQFRAYVERQPADRRPVLEVLAHANEPTTQADYALDLVEVAQFLRDRRNVDPARTGAVGFCFGGSMVARLATVDPDLRAGVIFYGRNPPLEKVPDIRAHLLGLYASEDPGITSTVPELAAAMQQQGRSFQFHVYPGAKHAFFNDRRPNYHEPSARDAWSRVSQFFATELAPSRP